MRTALIVGGSGGIGSAIAQRLAADGLRVRVAFVEHADRAEDLVASLPGEGHRAVHLDVCGPASIARVASSLLEQDGALDVLVNGAGVTGHVPHDDLEGLDDELIERIFRVNWTGAFATVRAMRPLLERSGAGVIVNLSSVAATTGLGSNVAYCASKAALDSMTRSLARALAPAIRVVSVSPGWVMGAYAAAAPPEVIAAQRDATPLGRLAEAEDVASAVSAVVHDLPFTTGAIVPVDGGRPLVS
jgi:3-oxoacyl-[acyl-carrier protein] reductase